MHATGDGATDPPRQIGFWAMCLGFFRLGCTGFGGGTAGWMYRDLVQRRRWIDDASFLADLALGQALPGANGIKLAILVGNRLHGGPGAVAAFVSLLAGPFAIILAAAAVYARYGEHRIVQAALDGVAAAAVGVTLAAGLRSAARAAAGPVPPVIAAATVFCVGFLRWPILPVVLGLAPVAIALALVRQRRP
jgi:chromate transporter